MGVAGPIFEPHPPNLVRIRFFLSCENAENFVRLSQTVYTQHGFALPHRPKGPMDDTECILVTLITYQANFVSDLIL